MHTRISDYAARSRAFVGEQPGVRQAVTGATLAFDEKRRRAYREEGLTPWKERAAPAGLARVAVRPGLYRVAGKVGTRLGATALARKLPMLGEWSRDRALPRPSPRTFRELWREGIE